MMEKKSVAFLDLNSDWAELNHPNDLTQFVLKGKARALSSLKGQLKKSIIGEQLLIEYNFWKKFPDESLDKIKASFNSNIVIRSNANEEDNWNTSNAGRFETVLNVDRLNYKEVSKALNKVFNSYEKIGENSEVLIQKYVSNVKLSGVLFCCDLNTGSPYFSINYDLSNSTDTVTSGKGKNLKNIIVSRLHSSYFQKLDEDLKLVVTAAKEIMDLLKFEKLDIEFALDFDDKVHIFQVRPILVDHSNFNFNSKNFKNEINLASRDFVNYQKKSNTIVGDKTIYSNMSDWNPAEMIGTHPSPLALSLYKYIITDENWAIQRAEFGYKNLIGIPYLSLSVDNPS